MIFLFAFVSLLIDPKTHLYLSYARIATSVGYNCCPHPVFETDVDSYLENICWQEASFPMFLPLCVCNGHSSHSKYPCTEHLYCYNGEDAGKYAKDDWLISSQFLPQSFLGRRSSSREITREEIEFFPGRNKNSFQDISRKDTDFFLGKKWISS